MKPYVIAVTGASGVRYALRLLQWLLTERHPVALVISDAARIVLREEESWVAEDWSTAGGIKARLNVSSEVPLEVYGSKDLSAPIASGSYPTQGMVVLPCSMGSLGAMASGVTLNLIHRAADCTLKENRRLILVPRETPLNGIHLENMLKLSKAGARIVPAMPGFYAGAETLQSMVDFMVGKVLDQMDIPHTLYPRWTGLSSRTPAVKP